VVEVGETVPEDQLDVFFALSKITGLLGLIAGKPQRLHRSGSGVQGHTVLCGFDARQALLDTFKERSLLQGSGLAPHSCMS